MMNRGTGIVILVALYGCQADDNAVCGDGLCAGAETRMSCPRDCGRDAGGERGETEGERCGNGFCGRGEHPSNCPADCGGSDGGGEACGDGRCGAGESSATCPTDCGVPGGSCGNGVCEAAENSGNCSADCREPECESHAYFECAPAAGNIYWFDSCGNTEGGYQRCCTGCRAGQRECPSPARGGVPGEGGGCCPGEPACN